MPNKVTRYPYRIRHFIQELNFIFLHSCNISFFKSEWKSIIIISIKRVFNLNLKLRLCKKSNCPLDFFFIISSLPKRAIKHTKKLYDNYMFNFVQNLRFPKWHCESFWLWPNWIQNQARTKLLSTGHFHKGKERE